MSEELSDIPQFVSVELMNRLVLFLEHPLEREDVFLVQHTEPLKTSINKIPLLSIPPSRVENFLSLHNRCCNITHARYESLKIKIIIKINSRLL